MSFIDSTQEAIEVVESRLKRLFSEVREEKEDNKTENPCFYDEPILTINRGSRMRYKYADEYDYISDWQQYNEF